MWGLLYCLYPLAGCGAVCVFAPYGFVACVVKYGGYCDGWHLRGLYEVRRYVEGGTGGYGRGVVTVGVDVNFVCRA